MIRAALLALAGLAVSPVLAQDTSVPVQAGPSVLSGSGAVLRGLDKVSGHKMDVELSRGGRAVIFGLDVRLGDCRYPRRNPTGDGYALLEVRRVGHPEIEFEGWMVASAPALNALDDPRYDVWLVRCKIS
ncbi:DUF2155 domain-containing protein [Chachezhania sediminis]|uniref:DUF2155 domain-containing protein n=1 Tax=Chachezhania sediminis TaxID=2599291 RepID=UPI00131C3801|nr:DUF2155 domain-containing protein [Chachezhania sediminis]